MIPPGMRAVPVRVNEVVGVAGFVVPGMRIDVLISGSRPNGDQNLGTITRTLLQNLEVLSAGTDFKKDPEGKPVQVQVVNLLVTPEQAELLSLASAQTQIQLVLRNPLDRDRDADAGNRAGAAVQRRETEAGRAGAGSQGARSADNIGSAEAAGHGVCRAPRSEEGRTVRDGDHLRHEEGRAEVRDERGG